MQTKELNLFKNDVKQITCALYEKNDSSNYIYIFYSTPITPNKTLLYNLKTDNYKVVKTQTIPSGYNEKLYCRKTICQFSRQ